MTCTVLYIVMSTSSTSWHLNMLVQNFPLGFRAICKTYKKTIEHDSFRFQNQFCTPRHSSCIWHSKCETGWWRVHDTQHYNLAVNYSRVDQFYCNVKIITMLTCSKPISPCRVASLGINFYLCYKYKLQRTHVTSWSCLLCNLLLPAMNLMLVTLNLTTSPITSFCLNWFRLFWLLLSYRMGQNFQFKFGLYI